MLDAAQLRRTPLDRWSSASDALGRPRRRRARPRGVGVPAGRRRRAPALRPRRERFCTRERLDAAGLPRRRRARRGRGAARAIGSTTSSPPTRTSTRRSSGCSATSAGRSTPAARATTRSLPRSGSTSPTPAPRPMRRCAGFASAVLERADEEADDADARLHPSAAREPVTLGHHLLAWVGDARTRPGALRVRGRAGGAVAARRRRARRLDAAAAGAAGRDAQLDRRRRRPRLRARLPLRGCGALHAPLAHRRGARPLDDRASSASRACPRTRRPGRR